MAFSQTMYIEIKEDVIRDAINKRTQEVNNSLDLLILMGLCVKQGKHIVSVPCLLTNKDLCKQMVSLIGTGAFRSLNKFNTFRYKYGDVIARLSIRCVISNKPQEQPDDKVIWITPYECSKFEPWTETHVLTENLADSSFYIHLAYYYAQTFVFQRKFKESDFAFCFYPLMGGGATIGKVLQMEINREQHFCLVIADSDKKWSGDVGYGDTAKKVIDVMEKFTPFNCRSYVMQKVREIENLIPRKFVEQYGDNNGYFGILNLDFSFFDMKVGLCLSELWHQEIFRYWRDMLGDTALFQERNTLRQQCQTKKDFDKVIKGKEPLKKGFGSNLLSLVIGDIDYLTAKKKFKPKMNHALYCITPLDLTPAQQEEWKNIGQLMFSWTCCLKCRI